MKLALIVEDDYLNRKLLHDILEIKFRVVEANSAENALLLLEKHDPSVIFLDMQLPGMDGTTFLRQLKKNPSTASIPVIGISARAFPDDIKQGREHGCIEYITKPIEEDPQPFVERMADLIEKYGGQHKALNGLGRMEMN